MPDFGRDLPPHGDHVQSRDIQRVPPHGAVILYIHCLQRDLQLVPFFQVVAGDDVGHSHLASGLLQIQAWADVLAGGGKGTDGQRAHVTQGGGNFVGQG